ncbi:hypothetical protein [Kineothrix sp. MB12-C1]|uniref:hypothetical protein n=1 Tax=Kineothrix sp. MB12-C1 TaxID=3070215 RepID=UPI0027D2B531|nr:hypothetical protein [Kineothrix sp. MB12-C1]WMC92731.1 hypothetical protein RBB56_00115 [Kineothrix sp. MB12-C1]
MEICMEIKEEKGVNMGTFKIILWDVDQTLLDFKKSESYAVAHCFEQFEFDSYGRNNRIIFRN